MYFLWIDNTEDELELDWECDDTSDSDWLSTHNSIWFTSVQRGIHIPLYLW